MTLKKPYELLAHTSDLKFRVTGEDLYQLFENCGYALFDVMSDLENVEIKEFHHIYLKGDDINLLLRDWLGELLYLNQVEDFLFIDFKIDYIRDCDLCGRAFGERFNPERHYIHREIKAITYQDLQVWRENSLFLATFVVDI